MRAVAFVVLAVGACGPVLAEEPAAGKLMDGYWQARSIRFDGKEQCPDAEARERLMLVTAGGEYRMYCMKDVKTGDAYRLFVADFRPDPVSKTFEMEIKEGQKKGLKVHGVYAVNGSQLTVCYATADKARPTTFEAPPGSGQFCEAWAYLNPQPKKAN